jgi:hypothetical protein
LLRRDNVEHLMMIGGPTDVVVEANIVHAPTPVRHPPRAPVATDTLPAPVPLDEGSMWPLQPEAAAAPLVKPPALDAAARPPARVAEGDTQGSPAAPPPLQPAPQRRTTQTQEPLVSLAGLFLGSDGATRT